MGYDETTNLKLKKPTVGTVKTEWPGYINGNFDTLDAEVQARHKTGEVFPENITPDADNTRSIGSAIRRFLGGFFNEITLGGVTRSTWPSPGSGSQSMDDTYNNGSQVDVDNTDEVRRLGAGKKFKLANADGSITYMEAEGGVGIMLTPHNDVTHANEIAGARFGEWSQGTLENVGADLASNGGFTADTTGWTPDLATLASVAGGQSGNCLEMTRSSWSIQTARAALTGLTIGKLYRMTVYVKSGTSGNEPFNISVLDALGATRYGLTSGVSSGSWVSYSVIITAPATSVMLSLEKNTATAGTMLFDSVTFYEVTPGCVGADSKGPDGWTKDAGISLYRESIAPGGSIYSLKAIGVAALGYIYQHIPSFQGFAGRTCAYGMWVTTSAANKARLGIYDGITWSWSPYHTGSGDREWLECPLAVSAANTQLVVAMTPGTDNTACFSQPMLILGAVIGAGNYGSRPGETIWLDAPVGLSTLHNKAGLSTTAATAISLEPDAGGLIGKGVKAVYLSMEANDSASAGGDCSANLGPASGNQPFCCSPAGLADSRAARAQGWVPLAADGSLTYALTATGSATLAVTKAGIVAVQY